MKKDKKKFPKYICFVGDKNPKQKIDIRGLILSEPEEEPLVVKYDETLDLLYAERNGKKYPIEFDYSS